MLKYTLTENLLTERPDDYMAQTVAAGAYDKERIIRLIRRLGNLYNTQNMESGVLVDCTFITQA